ncbi:MAG TPA: mannose-6-phosphate isomerase, class I [Spirochaetia bacterium]|nr:mannose-6-phosphate isomerase, class I [Spirochaetia bacterium]
MPVLRLENPIQHYDWGTPDAIPALLGMDEPDGKPCAELWMGAHPKAPSVAETEDGRVPLDRLIARDPVSALGAPTVERFGPALPFLFKVLSAARPLSIQAHPQKLKAERGFEKENAEAVPLDAPDRNYRDPNHKPEMLVALDDFEGLCGFRPIPEILRLIRTVAPREFERIAGNLVRNPGKVELAVLFYRFISYSANLKRDLLYYTERRIRRILDHEPDPAVRDALSWVLTLMRLFPGDVGALAPLILNHFRLTPGQALFIEPGQIHAYLRGTGLEIMANSDNVLRGALTSKNIDIPELLSVLSFVPEGVRIYGPRETGTAVEEYASEAAEFRLDRIRLEPGRDVPRGRPGPEILLCLEGWITISDTSGGPGRGGLALERGGCAFITADVRDYSLAGSGLAFRAGVTA